MTDAPPAPRIEIAPGYSIARLIVGGWQWSAGHTDRTISNDDLFATLRRLVEAGFTTFDCADIYTGVEERLGAFLRDLQRSGPETGLQIHTKFVPDRDDLATVDRAYVRRIVERSMTRLGVEALDLVQFAWWDYDVPGWLEVAGWLRDLQDEGKIRHLGATNFDTTHMREFAAAGLPFLTNQVQYSVLDHRPERSMAAFCRESPLRLIAYGALAGGFLSDRYRGSPAPAPPLENRSLTKYALVIDEFGGWIRFQGLLDILHELAVSYGTTVGTVALRYVLQRPAVAAVIVGMRNDQHLAATVEVGRVHLSADDVRRIDDYCRGRGPQGDVFDLERDPDGAHGRIMRYNLNREG